MPVKRKRKTTRKAAAKTPSRQPQGLLAVVFTEVKRNVSRAETLAEQLEALANRLTGSEPTRVTTESDPRPERATTIESIRDRNRDLRIANSRIEDVIKRIEQL